MLDVSALWEQLKTDAAGLVTAVVQHAETGEVLMVGYMNAEALEATLERRHVTFWSRSREELWEKGATPAPPAASTVASRASVLTRSQKMMVRARPGSTPEPPNRRRPGRACQAARA